MLFFLSSGKMRNNKNEFNLWGDWNVCTFELLWLFFGKEVVFSKITPSLFVDKASCTRQFESELSLHSLALLFPIKEGFFENLPVLPYP